MAAAKKAVSMAREFLKMEASGGILLVAASILALLVANSPLSGFYNYLLNEVEFSFGFSDSGVFDLELQKPLLLWINDGLMAIFFFLIGLEIKREVMEGELSSRERAILPAVAALGGIAVPAAIFWFFNNESPEYMSGWAIPAATDIAFALAVLGILGTRAPMALKILLTAIAVIDDLGAIIIIALFYSHDIHIVPLYFALAALVVLIALKVRKVSAIAPYAVTGFILWFAVLESGIHATLAGVLTALFIPLRCHKDPSHSPCEKLEHALHPWVAFVILPLFGFANAGVPFSGMTWDDLMHPVTLGIAAGLVVGKQIGVFIMLALAILLRLSPKPEGVSWLQLYAVSILCGIGFTMSLFIGGLAYDGTEMQVAVRMGVLGGSVISAFLGYLLLRFGSAQKDDKLSAVKT